MAKKKIHNANTNGFQKNPQNINRSGKNRKTVSSVILQLQKSGAEPVRPKQVVDLFESLLNCTETELNQIIADKEQPMLNRIVAKEMLNKKGFEIIEKMLDRVHGRPTQKVENQNLDLTAELDKIKKISFIDTKPE